MLCVAGLRNESFEVLLRENELVHDTKVLWFDLCDDRPKSTTYATQAGTYLPSHGIFDENKNTLSLERKALVVNMEGTTFQFDGI